MLKNENNLRVLEALLFVTDQPLDIDSLAVRFSEDTDIHALLRELKQLYDGRGIELMEIEGRWSFRSAPDLSERLKLEKQVQKPLSRAALETLSIIAYHQPVTRAEIENIRGVAVSSGTIDILAETGWVKPGRRRQVPGKPLTWVTTPDFMDHFGLENMADLPGVAEMKAAGLLDTRPAVDALPDMEDLFGGDREDENDDDVVTC